MRLAARMTAGARAQVDAITRASKRSVSDVVREAAILGVGGTVADAREVNRVMARVRAALVEAAGFPDPAKGRRPRGRGAPLTVSVRLPRVWGARVVAAGGLAVAVAYGITRVAAAARTRR